MAFRPYWLDASALAKLVLTEPGSNAVRNLVGSSSWFETTWLCVAEAHGVLKRLLVKRRIDSRAYHKALYILRSWIETERIRVRLDWLQTNPVNPHEVRCLAEKYDLDFADAIQLFEMRKGVLASTVGPSEAVFVSSDAGLLAAARAEGFKVWNPETDPDPPE
ncbi:MAG TPA: type II toxin-antitoxin system VapC family toxin [Nitrospira sp.]|nr:type II toxin-antitoxin system VapC family toxin [Nitrospira sp.]